MQLRWQFSTHLARELKEDTSFSARKAKFFCSFTSNCVAASAPHQTCVRSRPYADMGSTMSYRASSFLA